MRQLPVSFDYLEGANPLYPLREGSVTIIALKKKCCWVAASKAGAVLRAAVGGFSPRVDVVFARVASHR